MSFDQEIVQSILDGNETPTKRSKNNIPTQHGVPQKYLGKRKRKLQNMNSIDNTNIYEIFHKFKNRRDSIRLSASQIAAMAGFHPYSNLAKLLMDLVYQGAVGQRLLKHDANLLNIQLISEDEAINQIVKKAGSDVKNAFQQAIDISKGLVKVKSIQDADGIKRKIMSKVNMTNKLSKAEKKQLEEATRYGVNTGFGKEHEEDALDLYEKQCGWDVRCRNEDMKCWKFQRSKDGIACPMGPAETMYTIGKMDNSEHRQEICNSKDTAVIVIDGDSGDEDETESCRDRQSKEENTALKPIEIDSSQDDDATNRVRAKCSSGKGSAPLPTEHGKKREKEFFSIIGVVDGIREELFHAPTQKNGDTVDNDQDWTLRQVVVECKHRMKNAFSTPPFYDQIQAIVYCMMYNTTEAEIIQVMRNKRNGKSDQDSSTANTSEAGVKVAKESGTEEGCDSAVEQRSNMKIHQGNITIQCDRISLDDQIMQHHQNWNSTILPRLSSFVDAAYSVRGNDDKRYRMIRAAALALSGGDEGPWWEILLEECPWLIHCDTAFAKS